MHYLNILEQNLEQNMSSKTSHVRNKQPLVVINGIFIYLYFLISPVVKIRKLYM